jgi:hypothetical protein
MASGTHGISGRYPLVLKHHFIGMMLMEGKRSASGQLKAAGIGQDPSRCACPPLKKNVTFLLAGLTCRCSRNTAID